MIPCVDLQCPLMYAVVVISVHAKRCRFADGKCFGYRAKFPCTNYNGGSHMFAVDKFGFMMQCKSACHQLDVGKLQFYFRSSNNKLNSLNERFSLAIMCMNIRYLMM